MRDDLTRMTPAAAAEALARTALRVKRANGGWGEYLAAAPGRVLGWAQSHLGGGPVGHAAGGLAGLARDNPMAASALGGAALGGAAGLGSSLYGASGDDGEEPTPGLHLRRALTGAAAGGAAGAGLYGLYSHPGVRSAFGLDAPAPAAGGGGHTGPRYEVDDAFNQLPLEQQKAMVDARNATTYSGVAGAAGGHALGLAQAHPLTAAVGAADATRGLAAWNDASRAAQGRVPPPRTGVSRFLLGDRFVHPSRSSNPEHLLAGLKADKLAPEGARQALAQAISGGVDVSHGLGVPPQGAGKPGHVFSPQGAGKPGHVFSPEDIGAMRGEGAMADLRGRLGDAAKKGLTPGDARLRRDLFGEYMHTGSLGNKLRRYGPRAAMYGGTLMAEDLARHLYDRAFAGDGGQYVHAK